MKRPIFYFHGYPGSRIEGSLLQRDSKEKGLSIIAFDRPGYGYSVNNPQLTLTGCGEIVETLAEELGIQQYTLLAVSGGAPFALGAASELKQKVKKLTIVSGLGMLVDSQGKLQREVFDGMVFTNKSLLTLSMKLPKLAGCTSSLIAAWWKLFPKHMVHYFRYILPKADREIFSRAAFARFAVENVDEALRQGGAHASRDLRLYCSPWTFDLNAIQCEVNFWHGDADTYVPMGSSQRIMKHLPKANLKIIPQQGHFMFFDYLPQILEQAA